MPDTLLPRWLDDIAEYLRQHGPTELGELAQPHAVPRPAGVPPGTLKVALQSRPQRFTLQAHDGSGHTVHLSGSQSWQADLSAGASGQAAAASHAAAEASHAAAAAPNGHKFDDESLHGMYRALDQLAQRYRTSTWPVNRTQLEGVDAKTLFNMTRGKYVKVQGGTNLQWNVPRIQDAITRMPDRLKAGSSRASSPTAAELAPARAPSPTVAQPAPPRAPSLATVASPPRAVGSAGAQEQAQDSQRFDVQLVDEMVKLKFVLANEPAFNQDARGFVAVACKGAPERLDLVQVATDGKVFIFDCAKMPVRDVCNGLTPLLKNASLIKLLHDLHADAYALAVTGGVAPQDLVGLLDTQLVAEHLYGELHVGMQELLKKLSRATHPKAYAMTVQIAQQPGFWSKRPLTEPAIEYAAHCAAVLLDAWQTLADRTASDLPALIKASEQRATSAISRDGAHSLTFDLANDYALASAELLGVTRPSDAFEFKPLVPEVDAADIIELLPQNLRQKFQALGDRSDPLSWARDLLAGDANHRNAMATLSIEHVSDIVIDVGRRPHCWVGSKRVFLADDVERLTTSDDVEFVKKQVGGFGTDNRAGLDGKLHRISAIVNRDARVAGLTMRLGRSVLGNADMMIDLLLGSDKSILVLGEPGSGKTTIVREAARRLAETRNVVVVDTSNEIAGDGMIPHACIGLSRRMMVRSLDEQSAVMVECVQNHTPHVVSRSGA